MNKATNSRRTGMSGKNRERGKAKAPSSRIVPSSNYDLRTVEERWEKAGIGDSYTFRNICLEEKDDSLELGDGTTKVILNAVGTGKAKNDAISPQLLGFLQLVLGAEPPETDDSFAYARRVQDKVRVAKRSSKLWREYMNWEMYLLVERNKGIASGEILTLIRLILAKLSKGKPDNVIADEIEGSIDFVRQISSLSAGMGNPSPEAVLNAYRELEIEGKAIPPATNTPVDSGT